MQTSQPAVDAAAIASAVRLRGAGRGARLAVAELGVLVEVATRWRGAAV